MIRRLGGRAEYADRVNLGPIDLIVRDVDEKGRIAAVGVALEPPPPPPTIPAFLGASEIAERLRGAIRRRRARKDAPPADAPKPESG
jgi:cell volume regulation protein A